MTQVTEDVLERMVETIVEAVQPEAVVLFGSHARSDAGPYSDVDLLIVESRPFGKGRSRRKEMARLWRLLASFPVPKDILVYSKEEVEQWRDSLNHVLGRAMREGRVLYEQIR